MFGCETFSLTLKEIRNCEEFKDQDEGKRISAKLREKIRCWRKYTKNSCMRINKAGHKVAKSTRSIAACSCTKYIQKSCMKMTVLWDVTPSSPAARDKGFSGIYCP